jgi:capsular polysaccharide biosynthesis protein
MTTQLLQRNASPDGFGRAAPLTRTQIIWRSRFLIVGVALLIAGATWAASALLPKTYSASSDVLVTGRAPMASEDAVQGSNDLAAQYAQFAMTGVVLADASQRVQAPVNDLTANTLAGAVSNSNIVRVTVTAGSPDVAKRWATAVAAALVDQGRKLTTDGEQVAAAQLREIDRLIAKTNVEIRRSTAALQAARPGSASAVAANTSLNNAHQQVVALTVKRIDVVSQASREGPRGVRLTLLTVDPVVAKTAPRPLLYSVVALVAGLIIMIELAMVNERRRTPDHRERVFRPDLDG